MKKRPPKKVKLFDKKIVVSNDFKKTFVNFLKKYNVTLNTNCNDF